jgi:hypothetical protein
MVSQLYYLYVILMVNPTIKVKALLNNKEIYKENKQNYRNKYQNKSNNMKLKIKKNKNKKINKNNNSI